MTLFTIQISRAIFLVALLLTEVEICLSQQESTDALRGILKNRAGFAEIDLTSIGKGEMITKLLAADDRREVAVFGIIGINSSMEEVEKAFQNTILVKRKKTALGFGRLNDPPDVGEVEELTLEQKEIDNLKTCEINKCGLKLSAPMIERLRNGVDWNSDDYQRQTNILYRQILVEYLNSYLIKGNEALVKYQNKPETVDLYQEQESLLSNLVWVTETAPEFADYLRQYPKRHEPKVVDSFSWSKIKFGLKPVIILIHTATYTAEGMDLRQKVIVSKQIYASRYIDSSLGVTAIVEVPGTNGESLTCQLYTRERTWQQTSRSCARARRRSSSR